MKTILPLCTLLLLLAGCQRKFNLARADFDIRREAGFQPDTVLKHFNQGVYVLKICAQRSKIDGHQITTYDSCPYADIEADYLDKTIYLMFFDSNRVLYFSGRTLFATKRGIRQSNDLRNYAIDFGTRQNRDRQILRGYYYLEPPSPTQHADQHGHLRMELEKFNGETVQIHLRCESRPGFNGPVLVMEEAGFSEQGEYDLNETGPVMKTLDSVFQAKLEFFFCDTIQPKLLQGDTHSPLWPPPPGTAVSPAAVRQVTGALPW